MTRALLAKAHVHVSEELARAWSRYVSFPGPVLTIRQFLVPKGSTRVVESATLPTVNLAPLSRIVRKSRAALANQRWPV